MKGEIDMGESVVSRFLKGTHTAMVKHGPEILTGIGITGMVITTVLAVKATPKAMMLIEQDRYDREDEYTKVDVVKSCWKCYIPAAVVGASSIACLIGASSVSARRNAALMTAYNVTRTAMDEYKDKVIETIGEKKEQLIQENISKDKLAQNPVSENEVIVTDNNTTLFYDRTYGRYFKSDIESVKRAINAINRKIVTNGMDSASLNDFYEELGLPPIDVGYYVGWNIDDGEIQIDIDAQMADDGRTPCVVIRYNKLPKYEFDRY